MANQSQPPGTVGLNQAARLTGKNKAVLHRDADRGVLSYETNDKGHRVFQVAELGRVYGLKPVTGEETRENHFAVTDQKPPEPVRDELVAELRARIADLQAERDRWHQAYTELRALPAPATKTAEPDPPRRPWWRFWA
jgi:hypothetical protein